MESENGVPAPNYTQTPNYIFALMPLMGEAELRVTFAIIRKTFGWHKERDMLSLTQLEDLTGLSRQGVIDGTEQGMDRGTIERTPHGQSFDYSIVVNEVDQSETSQASRPELVKPVDQKRAKLVKPVDTQKKLKRKEINSANAENSAEGFDSQERTEKEKELQAKANAEFDAMPSASAGLPSRELTAATMDPHAELTELAEEIAAALDADLAHLPQAKTAARKMIVAYGDKARATLRVYLKNPKNREFVRDKNPNALVGLLQADYARSFKHNRHGGVLRTGVAYGG